MAISPKPPEAPETKPAEVLTPVDKALAAIADSPTGPLTKDWQEFICAQASTRVVTPEGEVCIFSDRHFFSKDKSVITFMVEQIATKGLLGIVVGEQLNDDDRNPAATLRRNVREEEREKLLELVKAKGIAALDPSSHNAGVGMLSSNNVAG